MHRIPIVLLPLCALRVAAAGPDGSVIAHDGNGHWRIGLHDLPRADIPRQPCHSCTGARG